jgi:hypothetical protein
MDDKDILLAEWKEIRESLRYFGNKRFAQLTVFLAAQGATLAAFLNPGAVHHRVIFQITGLVLAGLFLMMEASSVRYRKAVTARGEAVETELTKLELMSKHQPKGRALGATTATCVLYCGTAIFWIASFGCWIGEPLAVEPFRIIVAGDGRADYPPPSPYPFKSPRTEDEDGINKVITQEIVQAVLDEKAKMLLWTGDLTNVSEGDPATFERQLVAWRNLVKPLYDRGVTVLPVRGNHEIVWYDPKDVSDPRKEKDIPDARKIWDKVFSGRFALPANGPKGERNVSFYDVRDSVLVVGVDQYENPHSVNQPWLKRVLDEHKRPFTFVYGHEPAFSAGRHPDSETLAAFPPKRNEFWESLISGGSRVYFCGHDHFYDHMSIVRDGTDPGPEMHQVTAGTAGAPFYDQGMYGPNAGWKQSFIQHAKTCGYIVVEIERSKATITFKGRTSLEKYEVMDSFSYAAANQ